MIHDPLADSPDLAEVLRHLESAAAFLAFDLDGELNDQSTAAPELRANLADLVRALAAKAGAIYNAELDARLSAQLAEVLT